jgi:hypothetical protein
MGDARFEGGDFLLEDGQLLGLLEEVVANSLRQGRLGFVGARGCGDDWVSAGTFRRSNSLTRWDSVSIDACTAGRVNDSRKGVQAFLGYCYHKIRPQDPVSYIFCKFWFRMAVRGEARVQL